MRSSGKDRKILCFFKAQRLNKTLVQGDWELADRKVLRHPVTGKGKVKSQRPGRAFFWRGKGLTCKNKPDDRPKAVISLLSWAKRTLPRSSSRGRADAGAVAL